MTDRLDEAKRLHAAATPGHWCAPDCDGAETVTSGEGDEIANCATKLCSSGQDDADYIAFLHNIAPDLFALAEAAERALELLTYLGRTDLCVDDLRAAVARVRGQKP